MLSFPTIFLNSVLSIFASLSSVNSSCAFLSRRSSVQLFTSSLPVPETTFNGSEGERLGQLVVTPEVVASKINNINRISYQE